jgi:hypothetical protein
MLKQKQMKQKLQQKHIIKVSIFFKIQVSDL